MDSAILSRYAVPTVSLLIAILSYASQLLFHYIDPGPLDFRQRLIFNLLVAALWVSYGRACTTNPGKVPKDWQPDTVSLSKTSAKESLSRQRYCRKCDAVKPPRSHHCKVCKRCIPKMDHHCPWTSNCVSHFTFPHFMRFLWYAVTAMTYLEYFLFLRAQVIWHNRHLPSYLGPSVTQLIFLLMLLFLNSMTLFLVSITFFRTVWGLGGNVTTIESWEIERHEQLLRRARVLGGYLDGPDGIRVRIVRQEFPYDIGIWSNIVQGMGTRNFVAWFWPFSATPLTSGLSFEENGFEDQGTSWPPPDPDRMPRIERINMEEDPFTHPDANLSPEQELQAFKRRQHDDFQTRSSYYGIQRRRPFHERYDPDIGNQSNEDDYERSPDDVGLGEEGWRDTGGNALKDFGVDVDVEFYDEDDVPIAQLLKRRKELPLDHDTRR